VTDFVDVHVADHDHDTTTITFGTTIAIETTTRS